MGSPLVQTNLYAMAGIASQGIDWERERLVRKESKLMESSLSVTEIGDRQIQSAVDAVEEAAQLK